MIADRLRTVSLANYSHPIQTNLATPGTVVISKGHTLKKYIIILLIEIEDQQSTKADNISKISSDVRQSRMCSVLLEAISGKFKLSTKLVQTRGLNMPYVMHLSTISKVLHRNGTKYYKSFPLLLLDHCSAFGFCWSFPVLKLDLYDKNNLQIN